MNKKELITFLEDQLSIFKLDFQDPEHGEKAELLHKHYSIFLRMVEKLD